MLNLTEPENLEHILSVLLLFLRVWENNWPLLISNHQFLNYSFGWSPGTIQSLSSLDPVNHFRLASGPVPHQRTIYQWSSLYNPPHSGLSTLTIEPFIKYDHFTITMIYIVPYRAWLIIVAPSRAKTSICVDSCLSSAEKKLWLGWFPLGDNHYYNYLSRWPLILRFAFH